jgi:hypothetical protein
VKLFPFELRRIVKLAATPENIIVNIIVTLMPIFINDMLFDFSRNYLVLRTLYEVKLS